MTPNHSETMPGWSDNNRDSCIQNHAAPRRLVHPAFLFLLDHLEDAIVPLIPENRSSPPPEFPITILAFHLLTHAQIDSLARSYHQVWPPTPETLQYPAPMPPWIGTADEHKLDLNTKRWRFGYFIGLTACRTPYQPGFSDPVSPIELNNADMQLVQASSSVVRDFLESVDAGANSETVWQMLLVMEREWEDALARARTGRTMWTGPKSLFWD